MKQVEYSTARLTLKRWSNMDPDGPDQRQRIEPNQSPDLGFDLVWCPARRYAIKVCNKAVITEFRYRGNIDIWFICKQYAEFSTGITEV